MTAFDPNAPHTTTTPDGPTLIVFPGAPRTWEMALFLSEDGTPVLDVTTLMEGDGHDDAGRPFLRVYINHELALEHMPADARRWREGRDAAWEPFPAGLSANDRSVRLPYAALVGSATGSPVLVVANDLAAVQRAAVQQIRAMYGDDLGVSEHSSVAGLEYPELDDPEAVAAWADAAADDAAGALLAIYGPGGHDASMASQSDLDRAVLIVELTRGREQGQ